MTDPRPLVPTLIGPTAAGKTAVAAAIGVAVPLAVISADARQVYRGLDVGTAKPDARLRARVPHYGLDLVDPGERYSAGRFAREAREWLAEAGAAGRRAMVVGGTGLYVRALADGLFREPPLDPARRERLRAWVAGLQAGDAARWAGRLDPGFRGGGRQRAARAVEVALLTGRALSWWQREARAAAMLRPWYILLTLPREVLRRRIAERTHAMFAAGLVDEVRNVLGQGVAPDAPGLDAVGYREVVAVLQGRLAAARLADAVITATRRYAKRQETWFRHQLGGAPVVRLDATEPPERLAARILGHWKGAGGP